MLEDKDIIALTTVQLAAAIGQGRVTAERSLTAYLGRIDARDGEVKAWVHIDRERALSEAKEVDRVVAAGKPTGALAGVPIGIKDIIDTETMPTQCGSPAFKDRQPEYDAVCVARLKSAGAIILGKTVTTELATLTPNITHNPHNLAHTPGGSSSGSAAAVADGMIPAALGTQTGGSVIRPASFCGIYGFKPTFGLIPRVGVLEQSQTLDTVGVYGNSVEDLALLVDVIGGYDARDRACYQHMQGQVLRTTVEDFKVPPKVAFVRTAAWTDADSVTREAFEELVGELGDQAEEIGIEHSVTAGLEAHRIIGNFELAAHYGPILDKSPEMISARLTKQIEAARKLTVESYEAALAKREEIYASFEEIFVNYSAILTPSAMGPAPKGLETTGNPIFNSFWTLMGTPAVTLPMLATEDGLPMGVQLVAARREDGRLLRTARLFERMFAEDA